MRSIRGIMPNARTRCAPRQIPFDFAQGRLSPRRRERAVFGMTPLNSFPWL